MQSSEKIQILHQLIAKEKNKKKREKYEALLKWLLSQSKKKTTFKYGDFNKRFTKTQIEQDIKDLLGKKMKLSADNLFKKKADIIQKDIDDSEKNMAKIEANIKDALAKGDNAQARQLDIVLKQEVKEVDAKKEQLGILNSPFMQMFNSPGLTVATLPKKYHLNQEQIEKIYKQANAKYKTFNATMTNILKKTNIKIKDGQIYVDGVIDNSIPKKEEEEKQEHDEEKQPEADQPAPDLDPDSDYYNDDNAEGGSQFEEMMAQQLASVMRQYFLDNRSKLNSYDSQNAETQRIARDLKYKAMEKSNQAQHIESDIRAKELDQKTQAYYQLQYDNLIGILKQQIEDETQKKIPKIKNPL